MESNTYKHIVLFKLYDQVSEDDMQKALKLRQDLGQNNPDILRWTITLSVDTRKGRIIIEDSIFTNAESFQKFRISDKHQQVSAFMREIADWLVGDYLN